jgi:hypothetical protein
VILNVLYEDVHLIYSLIRNVYNILLRYNFTIKRDHVKYKIVYPKDGEEDIVNSISKYFMNRTNVKNVIIFHILVDCVKFIIKKLRHRVVLRVVPILCIQLNILYANHIIINLKGK